MPRKTRILSLLAKIHDGLERFIEQANKHETLDLISITMPDTVQSAAQYLSEDGLTADAKRLQSTADHLVAEVTGIFLHEVARKLPPEGQAAYVEFYGLAPPTGSETADQDVTRFDSIVGRACQLRDHVADLMDTLGESVASTPVDESLDAIEDSMQRPPRRIELAYQSFQGAERDTSRSLTNREAYEWLQEHGPDGYSLPAFETWSRYVRGGQRHYGTQKNTPRAGRTGRSIVPAEQL